MPVVMLMEAAPLLPARGALIGLDLGTKTIGVAASDPDRRLAAPVETIVRKRFNLDAERLFTLAADRRAAGFVLGLPINMDGTEGPRAQSTRAFARNLAKLTELPIALWDERLSTAAVERALIEADASRSKRKAVIDQHAAAYILARRARSAGALTPLHPICAPRLNFAASGARCRCRYDRGSPTAHPDRCRRPCRSRARVRH